MTAWCGYCGGSMVVVPGDERTTHPGCDHPQTRQPWDGIVTRELADAITGAKTSKPGSVGAVVGKLRQLGLKAPDRQIYEDVHRLLTVNELPPEQQSQPVTVKPASTIVGRPPTRVHRVPRADAVTAIHDAIGRVKQCVVVTPGGLTGTIARLLEHIPWLCWLADGVHGEPSEEALMTSQARAVVAADLMTAVTEGSRWIGIWGVFAVDLQYVPAVRRILTWAPRGLDPIYRLIAHPDHKRMALVSDDPDDPPGWPRLIVDALAAEPQSLHAT